MKKSRKEHPYQPLEGTAAIMAMWGLRMMLFLGGCRSARNPDGEIDLDDHEWRRLGLTPPGSGMRIKRFRSLARKRLSMLTRDKHLHDLPFRRNMDLLCRALGLSASERLTLEFVLLIKNDRFLDNMSDHLPDDLTAHARLDATLAAILDMETSGVSAALGAQGRLRMSGLLQLGDDIAIGLSGRFELMGGLLRTLFERHDDIYSLLRPFCPPAREPEIVLEDFPHLSREIDWMLRYLSHGIAQRRKGVNILLYGPPGTGKTELALNLAGACRATCYEVAMSDASGDSLRGKMRFSSYRLAQNILANGEQCIIVFDEVEDVFDSVGVGFLGLLMGAAERTDSKAWVNQVLENNPVPAVWISNEVRNMDPAHLRRFDLVVEVGIPPREVRKAALMRHLAPEIRQSISERWVERMAENSHISPAMIARAARTAVDIGEAQRGQVEGSMEAMLNAWCKAMALPRLQTAAGLEHLPYRPDLINTPTPLDHLMEGLKKSGRGRLCLYGPPGTGKTAFGKHVSRILDRPLLIKRASDIMSMWVGESEKNIAAMFDEAERDNAVLLLDEADSFLRDRRSARASWEVTQVNELLTWMEGFTGVFICSTNLMDSLDEASLRRFDMKIRFDPMRPEQRLAMFRQILMEAAGHEKGLKSGESENWAIRVQRDLEGVTHGDFAMVLRQIKLMGKTLNAGNLFQGLMAEVRLKASRSGGIGFTACI